MEIVDHRGDSDLHVPNSSAKMCHEPAMKRMRRENQSRRNDEFTKWTTDIYATSINRDWLTKVAVHVRRAIPCSKVNNCGSKRDDIRCHYWHGGVH